MAEAFDIRELVPEEGNVNELIQASYTTTNRNAALYGDVPLGELYTETWSTRIPRLLGNWDRARASGAVDNLGDPPGFRDALAALQQHGDRSFVTLIRGESNDETKPIFRAVESLWRRYGVRFPWLQGIPAEDGKTWETLNTMIRDAGDMRYRDLYERPRADFSAAALDATRAALDASLLYRTTTYYCCFRAPDTPSYFCRTTPYESFCVCPCTADGCAPASQSCTQ